MTDTNAPTTNLNPATKRFECADFLAVLSGFLDGVIDRNVAHEAEVHLNGCAQCREVVESAEAIDGDLRRAMHGLDGWPATLEDRIMNAALGRAPMYGSAAARRRLLFVAWTGWAAAAVAMVSFGLIWANSKARPDVAGPGTTVAKLHSESGDPPDRPDGDSLAVNDSTSNQAVTEDDSLDSPAPDRLADAQSPKPAPAPVINEAPIQAPVGAEWTPTMVALNVDTTSDEIDRAIFAGSGSDSLLARSAPEHSDFLAALIAFEKMQASAPKPKTAVDEPVISRDEHALAVADQPGTKTDDESDTQATRVAMADGADDQPVSTVAAADESDVDAGAVLHQASVLLSALGQAEDQSFGDVRLVQQAMEGDDVLDRLADARSRMHSPESVELVDMAWSVLEWTNGQLDQAELERVRDSIARNDLPRRMERLSDQYWN